MPVPYPHSPEPSDAVSHVVVAGTEALSESAQHRRYARAKSAGACTAEVTVSDPNAIDSPQVVIATLAVGS